MKEVFFCHSYILSISYQLRGIITAPLHQPRSRFGLAHKAPIQFYIHAWLEMQGDDLVAVTYPAIGAGDASNNRRYKFPILPCHINFKGTTRSHSFDTAAGQAFGRAGSR